MLLGRQHLRNYAAMPKTGSTTVHAALEAAGLLAASRHLPARNLPSPSWGTLRPPAAWYRSILAEARRQAAAGKAPALAFLRSTGGSVQALADWGAPSGFLPVNGIPLYAACVRFYYQQDGRWAVSMLVDTRSIDTMLPELGVPVGPHRNATHGMPMDDVRVCDEDLRIWEEAQALMP